MVTLRSLVQPTGGLFSSFDQFKHGAVESELFTTIVQLGDLSRLRDRGCIQTLRAVRPKHVFGCGTARTQERSLFLALTEGVERYSSCVYDEDQFIVASSRELGGEGLNLDDLPRCSRKELSHPRCPLRRPRNDEAIRWVKAISIVNGNEIYIPAVMVFLSVGYQFDSERFCFPLSTGCAAHVSYEAAVLNGILEVIERDALSLVWLQRLPIPMIDPDTISTDLLGYISNKIRKNDALENYFFDATLNLGIPTIFGVQVDRNDPVVTTIVACSTSTDPIAAIQKVARDMHALRASMQTTRQLPDSVDDFSDIFHGAAFMARKEHLHAFDFLFRSCNKIALSSIPRIGGIDPVADLELLLKRIRAEKLDSYVVDLSTDEAIKADLKVVRVVIPALQPLSFNYRARYLGHARLYEAPMQMGYRAYEESSLNPWPHPFA
jgi:ribosomal protein S12 methylthiotransferase accessory factor